MIEIEYFGGNCVKISDKKASIVVDDNLEELGLKTKISDKDISLVTSQDIKVDKGGRFTVDCPGDYEISEVSIKGIATRAHLDEAGERSTIYVIRMGDFTIAIIGHIYPEMTDDLAEKIGLVDVIIIPVGGSGYTLDPVGAMKVATQLEPKIVIPTHYADPAIKYTVPQTTLEEFVKLLGVGEVEPVKILKLKESDLGEKMRTVVVERS